MAAGDTSKAMLATIRFRLGEPAADRWQDSEIYNYMNEAQTAIAGEEALDAAMLPLTEIRNGVWSAGVYEYALPQDFLRERYVLVGGILARRMELLNMQALRSNVYYTPTKSNPFYSIVEGNLTFHTGSEDPTALTYTLYYVRKPMRVRAVTSLVASGTVLTTSAVHGLTTAANAADPIRLEDMTASAGSPNGNWEITSVTNTTQIVINSGAAAGTGGRMIHLFKGQIAADEDPLLGAVFYGPIMDWATARCREQALERGEADRQFNHFRLRMEVLKSRYGGGRPYDQIIGDPGRRQAQ
jgi:hypothetical protein